LRYYIQINENTTTTYLVDLPTGDEDEARDLAHDLNYSEIKSTNVNCHNWEIVSIEAKED
jgi:hypothetical protein